MRPEHSLACPLERSPLFGIGPNFEEKVQEKRSHARAPTNVEVTCRTGAGDLISGIARDISIGGMFIESEEVPVFGTQLTIECQLPGASQLSQLPAVVRWSNVGGFGIQFGLLGARETHLITKLLKLKP
jgi:hypothetical protein